MEKLLGKNWKTLVGGVLNAVGLSLAGFGMENRTLVIIGTVIGSAGVFLLGANAKDSDVTGVGKNAKTQLDIQREEQQE